MNLSVFELHITYGRNLRFVQCTSPKIKQAADEVSRKCERTVIIYAVHPLARFDRHLP
jgi:hypothetical protein